ncbi:MAG TPA: hypothetical protein ENG34_01245 [Candidatus Aenigmarchaeota archaeon]|nr:hypothetical protein [Candidatus Aenigmarchaeota archaeon]
MNIYPKEYFEYLNRSERKVDVKPFILISSILVFSFSFLFISPLIHEFSHVTFLKMNNCFYNIYSNLNPMTGFYAVIIPFTPMSPLRTFFALLSGIFGSYLILAFIYNLCKKVKDPKIKLLISSLILGFFIDILINSFNGDMVIALNMLGLPKFISLTSLFLFFAPLTFFMFKKFIENLNDFLDGSTVNS